MGDPTREEGYSLLEVLVAIIILTVCIVPMVGMFDAAINASGTGSDYDRARSQANRSLEHLRALDYEEAVRLHGPGGSGGCPGDDPEDRFSCTLTATFVDEDLGPGGGGSGTRMMLDVEVTWEDNSYRQAGLVTADSP